MKNLVFILMIFIGLGARAQTYSISGTVSDEKGATLPGATVFLANTKLATATDGSGKFKLSDLQPGVYELVAKMLGFTAFNQSIIIQKKSPDLRIVLKANSIMLDMVNITGISDDDRKKYLELFKQYFIGQSDNASKCKLLNPEVINFIYNKNTDVLEASSEKFIIMENKALGYNVHYLLKAFNMDMRRHVLYYDGASYLEELTGSKSQQEKWEKNRQLTYLGSKWHFFKAAFDNKLKEEGFLVYRYPNRLALERIRQEDPKMNFKDKNTGFEHMNYILPLHEPDMNYILPFHASDILFTSIDENIKLINLAALKKDSTLLYIVYTKKYEPYEFTISGRIIAPPFFDAKKKFLTGPMQISSIAPLSDSVMIDKNGNINPTSSIIYGGYWTWNMASGFLPPDYKIPPAITSTKK